MNTIQAAQLYDQFVKYSNHASPLKPQLLKLFVPAFWDGRLVLRSSWKGWLASHLTRSNEYQFNCAKTYQIFSKAMQTLFADQDYCKKLNPAFALKLYEELGEFELSSPQLGSLMDKSPEIESLQKLKGDKSTSYWENIRSLSHLHQAAPSQTSVDLKTLKSILSSNVSANPEDALNFLENFIQNNHAYAAQDWQSKLRRIRESCKDDLKTIEQFQNTTDVQERLSLMHTLSQDMVKRIQGLDSSSKEKKIIQFSYGPKILSISAFFELMRNIPEEALQKVAGSYKNTLLSKDLETVEMIGERVISKFIDSLGSSKQSAAVPKALLPDSERHIPENVRFWLPKIFETWLENILKKGVIGNAAMAMPDQNLAKALEWISENGDALFVRNPQALAKLKSELTDTFKIYFKSIHETYANGFVQIFKWSHKVVSPIFMELLGIDHLMVSGPLWLEFEKNQDGTFNVNVCSLGNALNYHPIDPSNGKHYAVMRLNNVNPEKLNEGFFFNLLKRHVDPIHDPSQSSKAYDIYFGPLATLGGTIDTKNAGDPSGMEAKSPTNWQLAINLLLRHDIERFNPSLHICFSAMVDFCRPMMREGRLIVPDIETCHTLEGTLKEIYSDLKQTSLSPEEKSRIKATCTVVKRGIFEFYEELNKFPLDIKIATLAIDKDLLKAAKDYVLGFNVTQKQLRGYCGILSYYLGQEFGEFIDHLLQHSEHLLREERLPVDNNASDGIFDQFYTGMYFNSIKHAVILSAIGVGLLSVGWTHLLAFGGFYYFLPMPNLDHLLPHALSRNLLMWYGRIKDALLSNFSEAIIRGIWALMPSGSKQKLKEAFDKWRKSTRAARLVLQGEKKVSFKLSSPLPLKPGESPKSVRVDDTIIANELQGLKRFAFSIKTQKSPLKPNDLNTNLQCHALTGTDVLTNITFDPQLSFNIQPNAQGTLEAVCDRFPGFHIAENQQHQALTHIPAYLILENPAGQKKVLIPKQQLKETLIGRGLAHISGPFSEIMLNTIAAMTQKKGDYFLVDLEPCIHTSEKSILTSSDHGACVYLLCLYYLTNNTKALKQTMRHLDWLCTTQPFTNSIIEQLVPLALIPFNFGGLKQFRRKLFSTIGQHIEKMAIEKDKQSSIGNGLLLGFVALMDLDALDSTSRQAFPPYQEYFLFKFAFRMLSNVLKQHSPKAATMAEYGGIETLIAAMGLSPTLNARFIELKKQFDVPESSILKHAKNVIGILKTPSSLPKYLHRDDTAETLNDTREERELYAARLLSYGRKLITTDIKNLDIPALFERMDPDIQSIPQLRSDEISSELIKSRFPAYYAIATNDHPNCTPALRQQLLEALMLIKGMGDKQAQVLLKYLETGFMYGDKCPPVSELFVNRGTDFFKQIKDVAFGNLLKNDVFDPIINAGWQLVGTHTLSHSLANSLLPYLFPPGLSQLTVAIITRTVQSMLFDNLTSVSKGLLRHLPSPSQPWVENSKKTILQKIGQSINSLVVPLNLILMANNLVNSFKPQPVDLGSNESNSLINNVGYLALSLVGSAFLRYSYAKLVNKKLKLGQVLPKYMGIPSLPLFDLISKTYNYIQPGLMSRFQKAVKFMANIEPEYVENRINDFASLKALDNTFIKVLLDQIPVKQPLRQFQSLMHHRTDLSKQIEREKQDILKLINTPFKFGPNDTISLTLKDIHNLLDKGTLSQEGKSAGLTNHEHLLMEAAIVRIDYYKFRLKQFDSILSMIKKGSSDEEIALKLREYADMKLQTLPISNLRKYLHYVASAKTQLISFENFANKPLSNVLDGNKIRFVAPLALDQKQLHDDLWNIYGKRSHWLQLSRETPLTVEKLQDYLVWIKGAHQAKEPWQQDFPVLQSIFIERMGLYLNQRDARQKGDKDLLILLKQILGFIKQHATMPRLDTQIQLTFPIKNPTVIAPNYYFITEACLKAIIQNEDLKPLIEKKNLSSIKSKMYHEVIKPRLAEKMLQYSRFEVVGKAKELDFINFVCDRAKHVPDWIGHNDQLYSEISLVKGILNHMLPLCFSNDMATAMKIPFEALFRKGLAMALNKLNPSQGEQLARALIASAKEQMGTHGITYEQTYLFKKFGHILIKEKFDKFDAEDVSKLIAHPEACLFYMRYFIWKESGYWQFSIQNTPDDFAGLFQQPAVDSKQAAYNEILETPDHDFKAWMSIFKEHENDMIEETEDDPANIFGFTAFEASQSDFINPLVDLGVEQKMQLTAKQAAMPKECPPYKNLLKTSSAYMPLYTEWPWWTPPQPLDFDSLKQTYPLYQVQDYLFKSKKPEFEKIAFAFDKRLWMTENFMHASKDSLEDILVHVKFNQKNMQITGIMPLTPREADAWKKILANKSQDRRHGAFLWNGLLNTHGAGYKPERLPTDFPGLVNQLKFLNGDTVYSQPEMLEWVQAHQPRHLKAAFDLITYEKNRQPKEGHDLDHIFIKTCNLPFEEQM